MLAKPRVWRQGINQTTPIYIAYQIDTHNSMWGLLSMCLFFLSIWSIRFGYTKHFHVSLMLCLIWLFYFSHLYLVVFLHILWYDSSKVLRHVPACLDLFAAIEFFSNKFLLFRLDIMFHILNFKTSNLVLILIGSLSLVLVVAKLH